MYLLNSGNQQGAGYEYRADGQTLSGSNPQLLLPKALSRATVTIANCSDTSMWIERGQARAHAALTSGVVTSVVFNTAGLDNAGFNYTYAPIVHVEGGGPGLATPTSWPGSKGQIQWSPPQGPTARPARIRCTVSGGAVNAFIIDDGGSGYANPPELWLENDPRDPFGCADPSLNSGTGYLLGATGQPNSVLTINGTACSTDPIALFCAATSKKFYVAYML